MTIGCPTEFAIPSAPRGEVPPGLTEFRWSTAAGATAYNVWLRNVPGVPRIIATAIGASATASLQAGAYEWFVEALFPGCPSTKSEVAPITVKRGRSRAADH